MAIVTVLSALPLLYNAFYISGGLDNDFMSFSLSDFNIGNMSDQNSYPPQCFFPAPLYLLPALCDFDGLISTSCYANVSQACPVHWDNPADFWSSLLTIFIGARQNCAPPSGTWIQDQGYCQCSVGYRGTVCRSGQPPSFTYGIAFMASSLVGVFSWIWMVRHRIELKKILQKRICPQERDFSILIQDLPPNSHLNRQALANYLSRTFNGSIKFLSFAFDDRDLYDAKHKLSQLKKDLSHLVTSSYKEQEKYFLKILTQNQISLGDFEISCDCGVIKSYKFQPSPSGWFEQMLSSLFPHPSIGFSLPNCFNCVYKFVHGKEYLPHETNCGFPEVLKVHPSDQSPANQSVFEKGARVAVQGLNLDSSQNGVIQDFDVATGRYNVLMDADNSLKQVQPENMQQITYTTVSLSEYYMNLFLGSKCSNVIQWNALLSAKKVLENQDTLYQNSGTAIATFTNISSQQAAVRIATRVACQGKDQPKKGRDPENSQDRSYTYQLSISEVDQPNDVIWRNFGVSIFNKFARFIASLSIAFFFIILCSVALAVLMQIGNCMDPLASGKLCLRLCYKRFRFFCQKKLKHHHPNLKKFCSVLVEVFSFLLHCFIARSLLQTKLLVLQHMAITRNGLMRML
jgi:hypothetical protein